MGTEKAYIMNDLYDPDYSGAGHQPYYHDQLAAVYGQYIVTAAEFIWTFSNPSADGMCVGVAINPSTQGTTVITGNYPYTFTERPNSCLRWINDSGSQNVTVRQRVSMPELEGVSYNEFISNDNYRANFGSQPSKKFFLRAAAAQTVSGSQQTIQFSLELRMHVRCYSRILPSTS
jgi:hypothetical protein